MTEADKQRDKRKKRRDKGLCIYCGEVAIKGRAYCVSHWLQNTKSAKKYELNNVKKRADYFSKRRLKRLDVGRCPKCGTLKDPDSDGNNIHCFNCAQGIHKKLYS